MHQHLLLSALSKELLRPWPLKQLVAVYHQIFAHRQMSWKNCSSPPNRDFTPHTNEFIRSKGEGLDMAGGGGSWKVAYADFTTAMMAFFMCMWLLNISDPKELEAISNWFRPSSAKKEHASRPRRASAQPFPQGK